MNRNRFRPWRLAFLLLVLVATNAQQLVAQVHWHASAAQVDASKAAASLPSLPANLHDDCLLCQIAAHAGASAPPVSACIAAIATGDLTLQSLQFASLVSVAQPAHAWQSRGPPAT